MEKIYEIKEYISKIGSLIENSELEDRDILSFKKKLKELEKTIEKTDYITLKTNKLLVLDQFKFLGYHSLDSKPIYKYIGTSYEEDIKFIHCEFELISLKNRDLMKRSTISFEMDSPNLYKILVERIQEDAQHAKENPVIEKVFYKSKMFFKLSFGEDNIDFFKEVKSKIEKTTKDLKGNIYTNINDNSTYVSGSELPSNLQNIVRFIGFSRIDGYPIIMGFCEDLNPELPFNQEKNTFTPSSSIKAQIHKLFNIDIKDKFLPQVVAAIEDHLPKFKL